MVEQALTVKQVAERLSLTVPRVYTLIFNGSLLGRRIGSGIGCVRVLPKDLADYQKRAAQPGKLRRATYPPKVYRCAEDVWPATGARTERPAHSPREHMLKVGDKVRYKVGRSCVVGQLTRIEKGGRAEILTAAGARIWRRLAAIEPE